MVVRNAKVLSLLLVLGSLSVIEILIMK